MQAQTVQTPLWDLNDMETSVSLMEILAQAFSRWPSPESLIDAVSNPLRDAT